MSDLPSSPEGESRSLYEEHQPRFRQESGATAHAQQFYVDSDNRLITLEEASNRLSGGGGGGSSAASPAVVTSEQYAELQQVVKREESAARLELLELDSFLHNQTQVKFGTQQGGPSSHSTCY